MKTAEDWLNENGYENTGFWNKESVYEVVTAFQYQHDKEIVKLIDDMIEVRKFLHVDSDWQSEILTLNELKKKINEKETGLQSKTLP